MKKLAKFKIDDNSIENYYSRPLQKFISKCRIQKHYLKEKCYILEMKKK